MRAIAGVVFAASLAIVIALAGPLLLFNSWFVSFEQSRHGVAERLGTDPATVDRVTGEILADLFTGGEFLVSLDGNAPLLDERARSHMRDVSGLVRSLALLVAVAGAALTVSALTMRHQRRRVGRLMLIGAGSVGAVAIALAIVFAVAFDAAFLAFHRIFFPAGTFLFEPGSNLIWLFPENFWFESALAAGAAIVVTAIIVALVGWRLLSPRRILQG